MDKNTSTKVFLERSFLTKKKEPVKTPPQTRNDNKEGKKQGAYMRKQHSLTRDWSE
ncbi:MAG: hypothetical protein ACQESC_02325 [Nanobdellota archaeon]